MPFKTSTHFDSNGAFLRLQPVDEDTVEGRAAQLSVRET